MAMSATIAVSPSTATVNQEVVATITVSNSGGSTVNVTQVDPLAFQTGVSAGSIPSAAVGYQNSASGYAGAKQLTPVAASGTALIILSYKFFAPSASGSTYDIKPILYSDDGSVFAPTAATVTVNKAS